MAVLFISDLHLCPSRPDLLRIFRDFLAGPARRAEALYILGDLFDYWIGDDDTDDPAANPQATEVATGLRSLREAGVPVYLMHGNRDFLIGERYCARAGVTLLPDPSVIDLCGRTTVLSHGDALCTEDTDYQEFRAKVRDPAWQRAFLARPLAQRRAEVEELRRASEAAKREKASEIMDASTTAIDDLLRSLGYPCLIHGHTHRPAHHEHKVDGHRCERWVLADWRDWGACLECTEPSGCRVLLFG
ncbi:MAG: UDP-2,3-diacylglucosamine diphosphatase [Betaproteobacteria bacterium]|nr:UDP-2,3-diacylglucosamine diphosphatase [Betaproteobacteria bacterium]